MRFVVDASSDARIVHHLRRLGHDVTRVGWDYPQTLSDREIMRLAADEGRVLVADDRDFGDLAFRLRLPHAGVVYLRLNTTDIVHTLSRLDVALDRHAHQLDQFLVVTDTAIRVRRP